MHELKRLMTPLVTLGLLALSASPLAAQGFPNVWQPTGTGDWNTSTNWLDSLGGNFVPDAFADDVATIDNGGTAQLSSAAQNNIAGLNVANGALQVQSSGSLNVTPGFDVLEGNATVGTNGTLTIASGGMVDVSHAIRTSGGLVSIASGGNLSGDSMTSGGTLELVGPSPNVDISGNLSLSNASILNPQISSNSFQAISVGGQASLGGTLNVDLSGVTPTLASTWNIIDAGSVSGAFSNVTASAAPGPGQSFIVQTVSGGANGNLVQLALQQILVLKVNRSTGAVVMQNLDGGGPIELDGYSIRSNLGSLVTSNWNSLQDQGVGGFQEANGSAAHLNELDPLGSSTVAGGTTFELGNVFSPNPSEFGQDVDELVFEYARPSDGAVFEGQIRYEGPGLNNFVLHVDPANGDSVLVNDSDFTVDIDGYTISSEAGSLVAGNFNSLESQQVDDWRAAPTSANRLSELNPSTETTFTPGLNFGLGNIFNIGSDGDLVLEYLFPGESDPRMGRVVYEPFVPQVGGGGADFNGDGIIDAADYAIWQANFGTASGASQGDGDANNDGAVGGGDFLSWQAGLGSSGGATAAAAAVPEPTAAVLTVLLAASLGFFRRNREVLR